jgi:hypothetical protein
VFIGVLTKHRFKGRRGRRPITSVACLLVSIFLALGTVAVPQGAESESDRFAREREVEATKDQIRSLAAEGQWEDVLRATDHLLLIDPDNAQAMFWKDKADRMLSASSSTGLFTTPGGSGEIGRREIIAPTPTPRPTPTPLPRVTAPPLTATSVRRGSAGLPTWLIIVIAVVALLLIAVAVAAFLSLRASRRRVAEALEEVQRKNQKAKAQKPVTGIGDLPTAVGGAQVAADFMADMPTGAGEADQPTFQEGDVMSSLAYAPDEKSTFDMRSGIGMPDLQTRQDVDVPSAQSQYSDVQPAQGDTFGAVESVNLDFGGGPAAPSGSISLGEPPPSRQAPAEDPDALTFNSLMFAGDQTQAPAPPKPPAPAEDPDALTFNSLMFAGDQTAMGGTGNQPAAPPPPAEDPNALSFNSLMFSPPEETKAAGSGDTLSQSKFNDEYNNVMFGGGAEETRAAGSGEGISLDFSDSIPLSGGLGSGASEDVTVGFGQSESETVRLEGTQSSSGADKLFQKQKANGIAALAAKDYERAIQCLTVAAGLKPGDPDVTANLEKAKKLRDA